MSESKMTPEQWSKMTPEQVGKAYWDHIDALVDAAPPLTDDQKARVRAALLPSALNPRRSSSAPSST